MLQSDSGGVINEQVRKENTFCASLVLKCRYIAFSLVNSMARMILDSIRFAIIFTFEEQKIDYFLSVFDTIFNNSYQNIGVVNNDGVLCTLILFTSGYMSLHQLFSELVASLLHLFNIYHNFSLSIFKHVFTSILSARGRNVRTSVRFSHFDICVLSAERICQDPARACTKPFTVRF